MIQPQYNPAYYPQAPATGASAVNIQIYEPKAYSGPMQMPQQMMQPDYTSQFYNYPAASMYQPGMPMMPYQQYMPQMQMPVNPYMTYPQYMPQQMPTVPEPQVMPQTAITPAPEQPPVQQQQQQQQQQQIQPQPEAAQPQPEAPPAPTVEQPAPQQANVIDLARVNGELASQDLNQQTEAITKVAQMSQAEPLIALQLVDNQVMQNLAAIVQKDTTQLPGPSNEQIAAAQKLQQGQQLTPEEQQLIEQSSPKEIAEKNKVFSMFTLAMLQKLQRDELDQFNAQAGNAGAGVVPPLKVQDLVGFNEIANTIVTSQIPAVKTAGIQALS